MIKTIPLRYVAEVKVSNVDKKSVDGERPVRLCNYTDVYYQDIIDPDTDFMAATATREQISAFSLRSGDILFTKDSETPDDIAVSAFVATDLPGVVSGYHLAVVRADPSRIEPRFLFRVMQSVYMREQFAVAASGVTRYGLTHGAIRGTRVPLAVSSLEEQRRIADFLDDQVIRIDQAIALRMEQRNRLDERRRSAVDLELISVSHGVIPLRRLVSDVCVGIVIQPAALYVSDDMPGVAALRGTDIREGWIDTATPVRLSVQGHRDNPRSQLRLGDVVVVRTGVAGTAAVVTADTMGWNCIDLVIVRPGPRLIPEFLELVLNHFVSQAKIGAAACGSIQAHFGVGAVRDLEIPNASTSDQRKLVQAITRTRTETSQARAAMEHQVRLLAERKRALITAAVTGEFDVTTATGRGVA
jgi:type I restriction enzyme S subunit